MKSSAKVAGIQLADLVAGYAREYGPPPKALFLQEICKNELFTKEKS